MMNQPISTPNQTTHQTLSNKYLHPSADEFRILSCNREVFERAKPYYDERLKCSGYTKKLSYTKTDDRTNKRKTEKEKLFGVIPHLVKTFKQT